MEYLSGLLIICWLMCSVTLLPIYYSIFYIKMDAWSAQHWYGFKSEEDFNKQRKFIILLTVTPFSIFMLISLIVTKLQNF